MKRVKPLPVAHPVYETAWSQYPDRLRVSMEDGKVVDYVMVVTQPKPVLKEFIDRVDEVIFGGYKYKTKGIGKRSGKEED